MLTTAVQRSCETCRHWDRYTTSDLSRSLGDCRYDPPRISETMLARMLPGFGIPLSDHCELEHDIYIASAFPVTHQESRCGRYESGEPL